MIWKTASGPLPQGWYWWRYDELDDDPEIVYSNGQSNVALVVGALEYAVQESGEWSGEWAGPITLPKNEDAA